MSDNPQKHDAFSEIYDLEVDGVADILKRLLDAGVGKAASFSADEKAALRALWIGFHKATA